MSCRNPAGSAPDVAGVARPEQGWRRAGKEVGWPVWSDWASWASGLKGGAVRGRAG